ncbi:MAG: DUF1190 domain-containing protein [Pseudomonadota bacterium]
MKRSRSIRLVALGSTGFLALAACEDADPLARSDFFRDTAECARANDEAACRQALIDARAQHLKSAPAFSSREACEAKFGAENCMETKEQPGQAALQAAGQAPAAGTGGSWYMPMMLGYMMGRSGGAMAQPVYRDTANTAYSGNQRLGQISARTMPPPQPPGAGVARGGFGGTGVGTVSS